MKLYSPLEFHLRYIALITNFTILYYWIIVLVGKLLKCKGKTENFCSSRFKGHYALLIFKSPIPRASFFEFFLSNFLLLDRSIRQCLKPTRLKIPHLIWKSNDWNNLIPNGITEFRDSPMWSAGMAFAMTLWSTVAGEFAVQLMKVALFLWSPVRSAMSLVPSSGGLIMAFELQWRFHCSRTAGFLRLAFLFSFSIFRKVEFLFKKCLFELKIKY